MALTAQQLADETSAKIERATRVLPVAVQMVNDYAPNAPDVLKDEATIRFAGYLLQADYGTVKSMKRWGRNRPTYTTNHAAAFRNSGAAMLLTRYRVRRAGATG